MPGQATAASTPKRHLVTGVWSVQNRSRNSTKRSSSWFVTSYGVADMISQGLKRIGQSLQDSGTIQNMPREARNGERGEKMKETLRKEKNVGPTSKSVASALPPTPAPSSVMRKDANSSSSRSESQARPSSQRANVSSRPVAQSAPRPPTAQDWHELLQDYRKEHEDRTLLEETVLAYKSERDHNQHQYASLESDFHASQLRIETLNEEVCKLNDEVCKLQAASFATMASARWVPMEVRQIRGEMEELHASIWKLARTYAADVWLARERDVEDLSSRLELRAVLNDVVRFDSKGVEGLDELANIKRASQLCLTALISDHIAVTILDQPFFMTADRQVFHDMYVRAARFDPRKAALWRSDTLRLMNPLDLDQEAAKIESAAVKQSADVTCANLATQYAKKIPALLLRRLESSIHEEFIQEIVSVYQKAGSLSLRLWVQRPSLRCEYLADLAEKKFDIKTKILQAHSLHRIDDPEDHTHDGKRIKVVVQPGFQASGTHEAEEYDRYQIWCPAVVYLDER